MIKAETLTKRYGPITAVDGLSFTVQHGEVLGFLGPNGAGKTTTMRILSGFVQPTSGHAEICGHPVEAQPTAAKSCIGYLPEGAPCYAEMTPQNFLDFIAAMRGLSGAAKRARMDDVTDRLSLGGVLDQPIGTLSKGFRRRVGFAQAILHDPPVLILDEPTDGLDPNQKHEIRNLINTISSDKVIIISTHILEEVGAVCNRVIIISEGKIAADETPDSLIKRSRYHNAVTLKFERTGNPEQAASEIRRLADIDHIEANQDARSITVFPANNALIITAIADMANAQNWPLEQLQLEPGRLDEVFRNVTTGEAIQ